MTKYILCTCGQVGGWIFFLGGGGGGVSLIAQLVKNLPAMQETLGQEDPLKKE